MHSARPCIFPGTTLPIKRLTILKHTRPFSSPPSSFLLAGTLVVLFLFLPGQAHAQRELAGAAPYLFGLRYDHVNQTTTHQFVLEAARVVAIADLLPQISPKSYFIVLNLAAGARFNENTSTAFRWKASLVDLNIYKSPISGGMTLMEFDRSKVVDLNARWFEVRVGPSFRLGSDGFSVTPRIIGVGGISTLKLGSANYSALGSEVNRSPLAFHVSYVAELSVEIGRSFVFTGDFSQYIHFGGSDAKFNRYGAEALVIPSVNYRLFARYQYEEAWMGKGDQQQTDQVHVGIRYITGY